jgi:hypothetical protein
MIAFAAFLPWEAVFGVTLNGFQVGTAGAWAVGIGMVVALAGLTQVNGRGIGTGTRVVAFLGGLAAVGLAIICWAEIQNQINDYGLVSAATGIFMAAIGGGLAMGASLMARR